MSTVYWYLLTKSEYIYLEEYIRVYIEDISDSLEPLLLTWFKLNLNMKK